MGYRQALTRQPHRDFIKCVAVVAVILLLTVTSVAQATAPDLSEPTRTQDFISKYPGLLAEFGKLLEKFQHEVQFPPARSQSRLSPLLPESTVFYAALPNYGDASHQALEIFREELQQRPVLRAWWHDELAANGPRVEESLEKVYQLSQYLGDEIVVSSSIQGRQASSLLVLAEVKKPGLKNFLQQMVKDLAGNSEPAIHLLDVQELATARDTGPTQQIVVLIRPDLVVAALDVATLRKFNSRLNTGSHAFATTPFGQRLAEEYEGGGATVLAAADLQTILKHLPSTSDQYMATFERTGFGDVKYLVSGHKNVDGVTISQTELSFTGPRHGMASWLAAPGPLRSLDFVSPQAILAATVRLKNPAEIFDDLKEFSTASNPNAFAGIAQMEAAWKLNLREDLLSHLGGEITLELDRLQPNPVWKVVLQVNDAERLQAALSVLLAGAHFRTQQFEEGGVTYYTLRIPSARESLEIEYTFVDGYLLMASSHETVTEAVRLHQTGESLARSGKFLASLPPGRLSEVSALLYEDPLKMAALRMRQVSPEIAESLSQAAVETSPAVICAYGEESVLREASRSAGFDAGAVLIVAAIAIPNLLRARIAANETSAVGTIRTANTAQVTYATTYPQKGFAHDMATLGPDPNMTGAISAEHASLIDGSLGNAHCTAGVWCLKSGFQFSLTAACARQRCREYVVVGTPVDSQAGSRSFCSTSDAVVRFKAGSPLTSPISVSECQSWSPLQ